MKGEDIKRDEKSIMNDYPDEFIRKMRLTGLISLRGMGRFIDINKTELNKVQYVLDNYSDYKKYQTEREYFDYMAKEDENLIDLTTEKISTEEHDHLLENWAKEYEFSTIKKELLILAKKGRSKDKILKLLAHPVRLEFLTAIAVKSKFSQIQVIPNYPCDDEGLPTSTAGGGKGDIECYENSDGILIEVSMSAGRQQVQAESSPVARHLQNFKEIVNSSMCIFIAPTIYPDTEDYYEWSRERKNIYIYPKTIDEFLDHIDSSEKLYIEDRAIQ